MPSSDSSTVSSQRAESLSAVELSHIEDMKAKLSAVWQDHRRFVSPAGREVFLDVIAKLLTQSEPPDISRKIPKPRTIVLKPDMTARECESMQTALVEALCSKEPSLRQFWGVRLQRCTTNDVETIVKAMWDSMGQGCLQQLITGILVAADQPTVPSDDPSLSPLENFAKRIAFVYQFIFAIEDVTEEERKRNLSRVHGMWMATKQDISHSTANNDVQDLIDDVLRHRNKQSNLQTFKEMTKPFCPDTCKILKSKDQTTGRYKRENILAAGYTFFHVGWVLMGVAQWTPAGKVPICKWIHAFLVMKEGMPDLISLLDRIVGATFGSSLLDPIITLSDKQKAALRNATTFAEVADIVEGAARRKVDD